MSEDLEYKLWLYDGIVRSYGDLKLALIALWGDNYSERRMRWLRMTGI